MQQRLARAGVVTTVVLAAGAGGTALYTGYHTWWLNRVVAAEHAESVEALVAQFESPPAAAFDVRLELDPLGRALTTLQAWAGDEQYHPEPEPEPQPWGAGSADGAPVAVVHIPRFADGWASPVVVGITDEALVGGVGWNPAMAAPGEIGNVGLAGHRNTYGKPLAQIEELQPGDEVILETEDGWYTYTVVGAEAVLPTSTQVWADVPRHPEAQAQEAWLTLVACHPPGSLEQRWVVYAQLTKVTERGW